MSILVPNASLVGHLCGIIVGYIYMLGYLKWLVPSQQWFARIETKVCCCCRSRTGYLIADGAQRNPDFQPYAIANNISQWMSQNNDQRNENNHNENNNFQNEPDHFQGRPHTINP